MRSLGSLLASRLRACRDEGEIPASSRLSLQSCMHMHQHSCMARHDKQVTDRSMHISACLHLIIAHTGSTLCTLRRGVFLAWLNHANSLLRSCSHATLEKVARASSQPANKYVSACTFECRSCASCDMRKFCLQPQHAEAMVLWKRAANLCQCRKIVFESFALSE
jgi:hypothetical protein